MKAIKRVLIVEDDHACEHALRQLVQSVEPDSVIECLAEGEMAALLLAQEHSAGRRFDLVIADIFLRGKLTGLELWGMHQDFYPFTPAIFTSSLGPKEFAAAAGKNPPPYLAKPFRLKESQELLRRYLSFC